MSDLATLRAKAREALRAGKLPNRRPERTWGGFGDGVECTLCGTPVEGDEIEIEVEFAQDIADSDPDQYRVHLRCFDAWELERRNLARGEEANAPGHEPPTAAPGSTAHPDSRSRPEQRRERPRVAGTGN